MTKRILIAGLFHETHTFLEGTTSLQDFQVLRGEELLACTGDSSPLGGALVSAKEFGWEVCPAVDFRAQPSAIVEDAVVECFWRELDQRARKPLARGLDGVFLVLHGAMVSQSFTDVEGEVLERLRSLVGPDLPVFGVFDLHANFSARMAQHANCLVAYRENPHSDARESAQRAAALLQRCFETGEVPRMHLAQPPIIWPPTGTGTANDPMQSLESMARELERTSPEFRAVNIAAGFAFADVPETGVSFSIATTGTEGTATNALDQLSAQAMQNKEQGNITDAPVSKVMSELLASPMAGLTVLVEPSDNIGGGAPGDGTGLLRAMIKHRLTNAAIAINDPEAVQQLASVAAGGKAIVAIGGKGSRLDPGPLTLEVELISRSDGQFELEDKQSHLASMAGDRFDMGPCAVVKHGGLTILLTSRKTPPFDLGQWRSQGIDPEQLSYIGVKAAVAHRRAYDPIAARMLWVDTPGPCSSNLTSLPFKRVRRPVFPLGAGD